MFGYPYSYRRSNDAPGSTSSFLISRPVYPSLSYSTSPSLSFVSSPHPISFPLLLPLFFSGLSPKADGPCKQMLPAQFLKETKKHKGWIQSKQNLLEGTQEASREVCGTINPGFDQGTAFYRQVERGSTQVVIKNNL